MAKSSLSRRTFSRFATWVIPFINGMARCFSYTFGFSALVCLLMFGATNVPAVFLTSLAFKLLCSFSIGVFLVSVIEGYDLAKMIEKKVEKKLKIQHELSKGGVKPPLNFFQKMYYRLAFLAVGFFAYVAPFITAIYKGGAMAGGTVGTILFVISASLAVPTILFTFSNPLGIGLAALGVICGVAVAAVSLVRDGKKFKDLAVSKVVKRLRARIKNLSSDITPDSHTHVKDVDPVFTTPGSHKTVMQSLGGQALQGNAHYAHPDPSSYADSYKSLPVFTPSLYHRPQYRNAPAEPTENRYVPMQPLYTTR